MKSTESNNKYFDLLNSTMEEASKRKFSTSESSNHYFHNLGGNLLDYLISVGQTGLWDRNYEIECIKLKENYTALIKYVTEVKKVAPKEILESEYNFFFSIDKFLEGLLDITNTKGIVLNELDPTNYVVNVAVAHDCIEKAYDMITNDFVFITGDHHEA